MKLAELAGERTDGNGVLDRPAQQQALDRATQRGIVYLAREVLQEALELLDRAVCSRQELGRVECPRLETLDVIEVGDHLAAEALDAAAHVHRVTSLEAKTDPVGLPKYPRRELAGAVSELEREVGAPVPGRQPVLSQAAEAAVEAVPGPQLGDGGRGAFGGSLGGGGFHAPMVTRAPDGPMLRVTE